MIIGIAEVEGEIGLDGLLVEVSNGQLGLGLRVDEGIDELSTHSLIEKFNSVLALVENEGAESVGDGEGKYTYGVVLIATTWSSLCVNLYVGCNY